jgi:hypothetical protein
MMAPSSFVFAFWLALGPPPEPTFEQSLVDLHAAAQSIVDVAPAEAIAAIERSLAVVEGHPEELLGDESAADELARARVALVWAHLAQGDIEAASTMMDEAIRSAGGRALPLYGLGPDIRTLHDQRLRALEQAGTAMIEVDCDECEVLVGDSRSPNPTNPLFLGRHRIWIFDPADELEPMFTEVTLDTPGQTITLVFRPAPMPQTIAPEPVFRPRARWAKILGMTLGAGAAVTGGVLLSLDGKCSNGDTPTADNVTTTCQDVWATRETGYALLGVGAGLFMGATVWLTVDEVRAGRARRTHAMIAWTLRF